MLRERDNMIKYAVFDVDGTLLDSMDMWIHFGENYLRTKGIIVGHELDEYIQYFSMREVSEYFSKEYHLGDASDIEEEFKEMTERFYFREVEMKSGVEKLLADLFENGVRMYIATATYASLVIPALERLGIYKYFEGIVTCSDVGHGKDRPDVFLSALEAIDGNITESWVFEDAMHGITTAKAAGFKVCGVYDPTEKENVQALKDICDIYTEDLSELSFTIINEK